MDKTYLEIKRVAVHMYSILLINEIKILGDMRKRMSFNESLKINYYNKCENICFLMNP